MKRNDLNAELRQFARILSPTSAERDLVSSVYAAVCDVLGDDKCIQIGSYPRYTAITPIHDLDVVFCLGEWNDYGRDPDSTMQNVATLLERNFKNPTCYHVRIAMQSHSVTIKFLDAKNEEKFAVDIVPAYSRGKNNYGDDMYMVPQVNGKRRGLRQYEWDPLNNSSWIASDPRGYIRLATEVGENQDFRKTVKLVKYWKKTACGLDGTLKLKSFHLEQVILKQFQEKPNQDVFGGAFTFFLKLPDTVLVKNQIKDRAQPGKYIDDYIADMSLEHRRLVMSLRDNVLVELEKVRNIVDVKRIMSAREVARDDKDEFLFERGIPMLFDPELKSVEIECADSGSLGNRAIRRASKRSGFPLQYKLKFSNKNSEFLGEYLWKVKNSRDLPMVERRGELTLGHTKNVPELTSFVGDHYVECYRVVNGECIDVDRFNVSVLNDGDI